MSHLVKKIKGRSTSEDIYLLAQGLSTLKKGEGFTYQDLNRKKFKKIKGDTY